MGPAPEMSSARWSDEEHDLLVQMTNDQIQLEEEDETMTISWTKHFQQVSARLQDHGYSRTPNACRGYWKREIQSQQANEQAAGPRWDDSEHQILVGMTEDQLELEKADPSAIIPWARHWKKISLHLQENGYTRSADACAAYWVLVQHNSGHVAGSLSGADADGPDWEANGVIDAEDDLSAARGDTSTQQSTKVQLWTNGEYENLLRLIQSRRSLEKLNGVESLSGLKFWTHVSQLHQQYGFDRSWEACKTYWENFGRSRSGFDERPRSSSKSGSETRLSESKLSGPSSLWSPVNEFEDAIMMSEKAALENATSNGFERDRLRSGMEEPGNQTLSSDPNVLGTTSINGAGYEPVRGRGGN